MSDGKLTHAGLFIARLILGAIFFYYGSQKLLMLFGGQGFNGTLEWMQKEHGIPAAFAALSIFAEFFGAIGVLSGFLTRLAAFGLACDMAVAAYLNFSGLDLYDQTTVQSFGFPLALMGMSLMLVASGAGKLSLDAKLARRGKKAEAA